MPKIGPFDNSLKYYLKAISFLTFAQERKACDRLRFFDVNLKRTNTGGDVGVYTKSTNTEEGLILSWPNKVQTSSVAIVRLL